MKKYIIAILIWIMIILIAILNGGFREYVLVIFIYFAIIELQKAIATEWLTSL